MSIEVGLARPVLVKDEETRVVGGDVKVVVDAATFAPCRRADGKERGPQGGFLAGFAR